MASPTLPKLWLASESPRRRNLLSAMGFQFGVVAPHIDEAIATGVTVEAVVVENAVDKARRAQEQAPDPSGIFIAADTLVVRQGKVLAKPADRQEAASMLRLLSGQTHEVLTGLALANGEKGEQTSLVRSQVHFRALSENEISHYVNTREPYDKSGGYAVQGLGALFIDRIEGSYTNVVGLPIEQFLKDLERFSGISIYQWFSN